MARIEYPAIVAYFHDGNHLGDVAEATRLKFKKKNLDAYTPYPVHGLEDCLGLKRSHVSTVTRYVIVTGWCLGFIFQAWTSSIDWATNIGGKPFVSWPAFIPVTFESGILMGGITNLLVMLAICRLYPRPKTLVLDPKLTDDKFALIVPITSGEEESDIVAYLESQGAEDCVVVEGADRKTMEYQMRPAILRTKGVLTHEASPAPAH